MFRLRWKDDGQGNRALPLWGRRDRFSSLCPALICYCAGGLERLLCSDCCWQTSSGYS